MKSVYILEYDQKWQEHFEKMPQEIQERFIKHKEKYETFPSLAFRHEEHIGYFVDEMGHYRVLFSCEETTKTRKFYFIGKHKEYEHFLGMSKK